MKTIHHRSAMVIPRDRAFSYVTDYRYIPDWFFGMRQFTPLTDQTTGIGATFAAAVVLGPKTLKSTVRISEWVDHELIRLESVDGLRIDSTWTFGDLGGETELAVRFGYELPGGLAGRALTAVVEPVVGQAVRHTDATLRERLAASTN